MTHILKALAYSLTSESTLDISVLLKYREQYMPEIDWHEIFLTYRLLRYMDK